MTPLIDNTGWSREEPDLRGCVYFAQAPDGPDVKIGFAGRGRLRQRIVQLNTGRSPASALEVIAVVPGTLKDESWWHRRFRADRRGREWFRFSADMQTVVRKLSSPYGPMPAIIEREFPHEQLTLFDRPDAAARTLDVAAAVRAEQAEVAELRAEVQELRHALEHLVRGEWARRP